jgi:NAD(P)H-dependent FMN reductase
LRILAISGSLRANSANTAVLEAIGLVAPVGTAIVRYAGLADLPPFNPDDDGETPPREVAALRAAVGAADALIVSSPEYAHGPPGTLKNLLDWLVASIEFPGKTVALINASPRAHHAQAQLVETLTTMNAVLAPPVPVDIPLLGRHLDAAAIAADAEIEGLLRGVLAVIGKRAGRP